MITVADIRYAPYLRTFWSICKNIKKRKFKSLLRPFWDRKYAADIAHQWRVTGEHPLDTFRTYMPLNLINPSHDINYPKWVDKLRYDLAVMNKPCDPIKIIWDRFNLKWITVDGNHRLAAMKAECPYSMDIAVIVLYPKHEFKPKTDMEIGQYGEF
jgi:hypothetical protein